MDLGKNFSKGVDYEKKIFSNADTSVASACGSNQRQRNNKSNHRKYRFAFCVYSIKE
jgi:hypothetical protein